MIQQIYFSAPGQVELRKAPPPAAAGAGEVLLRPAFVGICGTDLYVLHGAYRVKPPLVIGHEMSGVVEAVGTDVVRFSAGDHVALNPAVPCQACQPCRRGRFNICEQTMTIGFRLPGAAQTKLKVDQSQLHPVPAGVALHHAVLAEPLSVGTHAVSRAADLGHVLIIGGGTIGLSVLVAAKAAGATHVTLVEPVESKRMRALRLGAADVMAPGESVPERRFTACFDIVANQSTLDLAEASCMSGGTIVLVGTGFARLGFNFPRLQRYEITVCGSSIFLNADMKQALCLLQSGAFDPAVFVTDDRPLAQAAQAYADAGRPDNVKVLIRMQEP